TAVKIVQNADITFTDVRIPAENKLEKANTFADTNVILLGSRNGLGWQAVGAQQGILDAARRYALERTQFGGRSPGISWCSPCSCRSRQPGGHPGHGAPGGAGWRPR
ncbi:hypothetical protein ACNQUF_12410, partial [Corynebacterium diphtheriae]